MKTNLLSIQFAFVMVVCCSVRAQGFVYDQQISNLNTPGGYVDYQSGQSIAQSFIPTLSSVDFATFFLGDPHPSGVGATVIVNLWSDSPTSGTLLGSTVPIFIPVEFNNAINFFFSTPVTVTPGKTYYLQPAIQSGDTIGAGLVPGPLYLNGTLFLNGAASPGSNLWFREGVIVPEPSSTCMILTGVAGLYLYRRKSQ